MDEYYTLRHLAGPCGGWAVVWLTYAAARQRITLRMLFVLLTGFAILFALARPILK